MARGLPDFHNPETVVSQRLADLNDLLAAVIGVAPLDNRGRIFFLDRFQNGPVSWVASNAGDANAIVSSNAVSHIPPCSMRMDAGTVGGSGSTTLYAQFGAPTVTNIGLEFSHLYIDTGPRLEAALVYQGSANQLSGELRIHAETGVVEYKTGGAYTTLTTLTVPAAAGTWLPIKLVINIDDGEYERILVGTEQFDVSGNALVSAATGLVGQVRPVFISTPEGAGTRTTYLGYVILTLDEP